MSIIFATLEQLESEEPGRAGTGGRDAVPAVTGGRGSFPMRWVAASTLLGILGAGVFLGYRVGEAQAVPGSARSVAPSRDLVEVPAVPDSARSVASSQNVAEAQAVSGSVLSVDSSQNVTEGELPEKPPLSMSEHEVATAGVSTALVATASVTPDSAAVRQGAIAPKAAKVERAVGSIAAHSAQAASVATVAVSAVMSDDSHPVTTGSEIEPAVQEDSGPMFASSISSPHDGTDRVLEAARAALSGGRYEEALRELDALASRQVNRADYWLMTGSARLAMGQLDQAETAFSSARALAPDNPQVAIQQAILEQERGDHASALRILDSAAVNHPRMPEIFLNQGYSLYALGDVQDASYRFRKFLKMTEGRSLYSRQRQVVSEWLAQATPVVN